MDAAGTRQVAARGGLRWAVGALLFVLFMLHSTAFLPVRLLSQIEAWTYDARVRLTATGEASRDIVILDMDERTLAAEGWPLPRDRLAKLVDLLFEQHGVRALGSDILFSEPDRSAGAALLKRLAREDLADLPGFAARAEQLAPSFDHDARFAESLRNRPVVLAGFFKPRTAPGEPATSGALCAPLLSAKGAAFYAVDFVQARGWGGNLAALQAATPHCGFFDNPTLDADGVYRRVALLQQFEGALYPSLALAVVRVALGDVPLSLEFSPPDSRTSLNLENLRIGELSVPVDGDVAALVPYRGRFGAFPYVSVTDVLNGKADDTVLRGRIVLLGTSAAGLLDLRSTPVGQNYAGVEVHANLVAGMLEGTVKRAPTYKVGIEFTMLLTIALLFGLLFPRMTPLRGALMAAAIVVALFAFALWMWVAQDFVVPLGVPVLFALTLFMAHLLLGYFVESRRARDTQTKFGQYVPPEIVSEMAASEDAISMEGDTREMSVLFSDVRGFTDISEKLEARELSALMNALLTCQTAVVQKHRGTIDKYMGDAVMAFWGAPLDDAEHARHALEAALEMSAAVQALDATFAARGWPPLRIGVGVNSGKMHVGNMGSAFRVAYTVMGDAVNLGSRIESLTKEYGVSVLCTETTRSAVGSEWSFREVDLVRVKGRTTPVAIYEPMGLKEKLDPALRQDLARHRGAMILYREQRWDEAEAEFVGLSRSARPHPVYELFIERIRNLRREAPGPGWDGVYTHLHK